MKKGWSTGKIVGVTLGGIAASLVLGISFVISVYQLSYFFEKMDQKSRSRYDRVLEENSGQERKEDDFSEGQKEPDEEETEDFGGYSSQPDGEYYDFTNDIRSDLSYQVEFRSFLKNDFVTREGAGAAVMEYSYPQISGDAKNLDGINDALQEELRIVEEHIASSVDYLTGDEEYRFEGVGYVTYMSEKILSVIYVEYGYLNGSYLESYVVSYNVDMETGMLMNNTHLLDYLYMKYKVKSAGELGKSWELYQQEKEERHKYLQAELQLDEYQQELLHVLRRYQIKDPMIWLQQTQALLDRKEMVEIRHNLIIRRQSLRRRMDYNKEVIAGKAQEEIKDLVESYPKYAGEIMNIVDEYEKDFS